MARTKRLASADSYLKKLDKANKKSQDDGAIADMFRRMAETGAVAVKRKE